METGRTLLTLPETVEHTRLSRATIYSFMKNGNFPKPIHLGKRSLWLQDEVDSWIEARIVERDRS